MTPKQFKSCAVEAGLAAKTKKILLVDDSSTSRMASRMLLAARGSYVLSSACDGAEGVEKAIAERPDLILMDIEMPRMNGLEACRLLKQNQATKNIPVILLSMRGEDSFVEQGYASGCAGFLAKPMKEHDLMAAIEAQLGR